MITTAAVTVGTSLYETLAALGRAPSAVAWLEGQADDKGRSRLADFTGVLERIRRAVLGKHWEAAGETLASLPPDLPFWGAEVATLRTLRHEPECRRLQQLVLLASDSEAGQAAAASLVAALTGWERLVVSQRVIADLDPAAPARFKVSGLRNLVAALGRVAKEARPHTPVFVVSGGFKAQVALTAVVGQALGVPVAYRFEAFPETIWLPPLPVRLDLEVLAPVVDLLRLGEITDEDLRARLGAPLTEANQAWARVRALLSPAPDGPDGQRWGLSPLGQLVLEMQSTAET
jgi:putative CRISPR-associated protein (TIGR02619 family)